ncbi:FdhD protein [Mucilaginibacter yixingensis]|uniref:Sulfur carrier protein FdhD n=1 Tax=Mucilaginibacter yixingensis TaxID=1295612 RepID=A0A2T5J5T8_9SPHI|nr:formate dehydrogenase accessory sulfurtransferase FdhD [Mucilaginibacter yixingensis]PTQ93614.1 FdhD protein [Mucilaginibacter yixingensis]
MPTISIDELEIIKVNGSESEVTFDELAAEEPLEIRLEYGDKDNRRVKNISVTMRTPGNDVELATGFLFTEGIVNNVEDIVLAEPLQISCDEDKENTILISLREGVEPKLGNADRNFYTTSSCGVCGKSSINAIRTVNNYAAVEGQGQIKADVLYTLPVILRKHQDLFDHTGGLHASALFSTDGEFLLVREDVGRHNALDKLIGAALQKVWLPLQSQVLLLSGRASFELIQKAAMAGIRIIASVGAPSTLAVETARSFGITLAGFLRGRRFNIYTSSHRILRAPEL